MMKTYKARSKKGFTLMEMLIVIAIIAILVAIALPTFTGALDRARYAADLANTRAWYAEQQIALMTDDSATPPTAGVTSAVTIQMTGATVTVGPATGTITADNLTVTYDSGSDDFDDVAFGN